MSQTAKGAKIYSAAVAATTEGPPFGKEGEEKIKLHTHSYCCLDYAQVTLLLMMKFGQSMVMVCLNRESIFPVQPVLLHFNLSYIDHILAFESVKSPKAEIFCRYMMLLGTEYIV